MPLVYGLSNPRDMLSKLHRAHERLINAVSDEDDTRIGDAIFDFAVTGYHIRDWVKQGADLGAEADELVQASSSLQACRDICNSSKHFQIDRYLPKTKDVYFSAPPLREVSEQFKGAIKVLMSDGQKFEVTEFASDVLRLWDDFFDRFALGTGT